jgi:hypothetical protein
MGYCMRCAELYVKVSYTIIQPLRIVLFSFNSPSVVMYAICLPMLLSIVVEASSYSFPLFAASSASASRRTIWKGGDSKGGGRSPFSDPGKNNETSYYLASKSRSAQLLIRAPSIGSFLLLKGWTDSSLDTFTAAVNHIVQENPVLTGQCFGDIFSIQPDEIRIYPGAFLPNNHSFVQVIDISSDTTCPSPADLQSPTEVLRYINRHVSPLIGKGGKSVADIIKNQLPLFRVNVVRLKDNYAVMYIEMSHCIGDLVTFYHIAEQIACSEKGEQIRPIEWDNPGIASHELYPDTFTKRDVDRFYGLAFFFGILWQLPGSILFRKTQCLLLSREKIKLKVDEIEARGGGRRVTSNDIVTAALCDMCRSTDVFAFTRSMRGIVPGLKRRTGGNLHCEVPFQRCAGRNPRIIQDIVGKGRYFEPNEIPLCTSLLGRVGRITNCVISCGKLAFGGAQTVCVFPPTTFLDVPIDTAFIFMADKQTLGVLHNFRETEESELLNDILLVNQEPL